VVVIHIQVLLPWWVFADGAHTSLALKEGVIFLKTHLIVVL